MSSRCASTSSAESAAPAPGQMMIALSPDPSSTKIEAAPVGFSGSWMTCGVTPAPDQVSSAICAKGSRPSRVIMCASAPARAAATAWFEPLPPGPRLKALPRIVSPIRAWRSAR